MKKQLYHLECEAKIFVDEQDIRFRSLPERDQARIRSLCSMICRSDRVVNFAKMIVKVWFDVSCTSFYSVFLVNSRGEKSYAACASTYEEARKLIFHVIPSSYVSLISKGCIGYSPE